MRRVCSLAGNGEVHVVQEEKNKLSSSAPFFFIAKQAWSCSLKYLSLLPHTTRENIPSSFEIVCILQKIREKHYLPFSCFIPRKATKQPKCPKSHQKVYTGRGWKFKTIQWLLLLPAFDDIMVDKSSKNQATQLEVSTIDWMPGISCKCSQLSQPIQEISFSVCRAVVVPWIPLVQVVSQARASERRTRRNWRCCEATGEEKRKPARWDQV